VNNVSSKTRTNQAEVPFILSKAPGYYAKLFAYKYSGVMVRPLMTFIPGRVFPARLANPLIGGRGCIKEKDALA